MRNIVIPVFISLLLIVGFASCGGSGNRLGGKRNPENIAEQFLNALQFGDYDEAKSLSTQETREALDLLESTAKLSGNQFSKDFEVVRSEIDGDYAKVYYTQEMGEEMRFIKLRKDREKGWLVLMSKSDFSNNDINLTFDNDSERDNFGTSDRPSKLSGPSAVAWDFLAALQFGDYDGAKQLGTEETREALELQSTLLAGQKNPFEKEFVIIDEEITNGKYAKVYYQQEGEADPDYIKLRKDPDGWKVIMSKSDWNNQRKDSPDDMNQAFDEMESEMEIMAKEIEKELKRDK